MANLKEVRNRITSVNSTMQITSAMKMVSAAKLRRAQDAIIQMRPYSEKMSEILSNLTQGLDTSENAFAAEREVKSVLFVAVTSNRGLCGAFNANIIKRIKALMVSEYSGAKATVMSLGKKANDTFGRLEATQNIEGLELNRSDIYDDLTFENASTIAQDVMDAYVNGKFDKVVVVYNQFKNAAIQVVITEQFLPVIPPSEVSSASSDYIFEPSKEEILENLIPRSLKTQLFKALLDSNASEHGARMTAMHKATDNASDMLSELKLTYNKARQAAITTEILEIVGGAEALGG